MTNKKLKQRIRYVKKDGKLVSKNEVISKTGSRYVVHIDLETKTYVIRNQVSLRKYEGGQNINNMNVLKRVIKKHLQHLGIEFESERRKRSFGICSQGYNQKEHLAKQKQEKTE